MKINRIIFIVLLAILAITSLGFSPPSAGSNVLSIAPSKITTQKGKSDGLVTNLSTQDQSGTQNSSDYYVRLATPSSVYTGLFIFMMPSPVDTANIQSISVVSNFNGPTKVNQLWTWEIYDWITKKWILLGDNTGSDGTHWLTQTFNVPGTLNHFAKVKTGEIRVRIVSSNKDYDSWLDYLRIQVTTPAPAPPPTLPVPVGQPGNWTMTFSDDFNGSSLDTTKWRPNWLGANDASITKPVHKNETSCYDPAQVSVTSGELRLTAIKKNCLTYAYSSGLVESNNKFNFTYGAMEARVSVATSSGQIVGWPAFWADGQNWPKDGELDVFEGLGGLPCFHFHYNTSANAPGGCVSSANGWASGWHTYGAYWQLGRIDYYYDGVLVWTNTSGVTKKPMFLVLNMGIDKAHIPTTFPVVMHVDYVRVWSPVP